MSRGGMSETRKAKLMDLKKREDLKDALVDKFKVRFGHGGAGKSSDEMSVCSETIANEVNRFARSATITEANLMRLEGRLQGRAQGQLPKIGEDNQSMISGVSGYSTMSRARSLTSLAGKNLVQGSGAPKSYDWTKLDEYAGYLHEQDSLRQQIGVKALQRKMKMDLDFQVNQKVLKKEDALEEERRYHQNSQLELERWKTQEQSRAEEKHAKIGREKKDRDDQRAYEIKIRDEESSKKKNEEANLVEKIIDEMEEEQRRFEKKKEKTKKSMKKVFEENMADQQKRNQGKRDQMVKEAADMKEYNRILDEQEAQRAEELAQRMERQGELMKKLMSNMDATKKGAGANDAQRALAQQEEQDRHFFEAEHVKHNRLHDMRIENQAYLLKQMEEKAGRGDEDKYLTRIQAQILERDTEEYNNIEAQKVVDRKSRNLEHRKDIERQMEYKMRQSVPEMSQVEISLNKPLLQLVDMTLDARDANTLAQSQLKRTRIHEEDEE